MADKIIHLRSLTEGSIPTTSSLGVGQLAINVPDGKIFVRKSGSNSDTVEAAIITNAHNSGSIYLTGSISLSGSLYYDRPTYNTASIDVLVRNSTTGEVEYTLPSYLTNAKNVIRVGITGSAGVDFTSIKSAVDSITDASATNPYVVQVRAGKFVEDPITMKSYVAVVGMNSTATIIQAKNSASVLINGADQSMIQDVQIQGCTFTGSAAVEYKSSTTPQLNAIFYVENVRFGENYTHARTVGTGGGNCIMQCSNVKYGGYPFTIGFHVTNDGSGIGRMQLRNVTSTNGGVTTTTGLVFAKADKPGCTFIVNGCLLTKAVGAAAGTGFLVYDGGSLRLTGVNFQRWVKGIHAPQSGSAPSIDAIALNFENCTTDVAIEHSGSIGKVQGTDNFLKTQITSSAPLYEVGQDPRRIFVATKGGDFSSIKSAVDWITDSSETNRYVIEVGPGAFYEQEINMVGKPYVSIVGSNIQTTEIFPTGSNQNIIKIGVNNELSFLSLTNAPVGYAAILADDIGDFGQCHKISFYNCDTNIKVIARTQDTQFYGEYIDFNGTYSYGAYASGSNGFYALVNLENYYQYPSGSPNLVANEAIGTTELDLRAAVFNGESEANSVGLRLSAGANTEGTALDIQNFGRGVQILNFENSSSFDIVGSMIHDSVNYDFDVLHPNASCRFQGTSDHSMINNASNNFFWNFLDKVDGELDITRKVSVTFDDGTHTDASTLIFKGSPMGVMQGGAITILSGLTITTAAGFGYLQDSVSTSSYHRYDWNDTNLALPANSECYIHIDDTGTLSYALSEVDYVTNIVLGRVITNATGIEIIEQSPYDGQHTSNKLSEFNKLALGSVYSNGSIVSDSGSYKLNVTAGTYYFSENRFDPSGGNGINFTQYFRSASVWDRSVTSTVAGNLFDSGSNVLTALSESAYTKHTLYVIGQGVDEKYMLVIGQAEYSTLVQAENAGLPTPPTYFQYGIVPIASVYVQSGSAGIIQIQDIRPVIGFKAAGVNAASVHGNLLGLGADDHKQYLLTSGVRAMDGNLNMGNFNITNTNSITANSFTGSLFGTSSYANNADNLDGFGAVSFAITGSNTFNGNQIVSGSLTISGSVTASIVTNPYGNLILASSGSSISSGSVEIHGGLKWKRTPTAVATEIGDLITFGATVGAIEGGELTTSSLGGFVVQVAEMVAYTMTTLPYSNHNLTKFDTFGSSEASRQLTLPQTSSNYVYYNNSGVLTYAATLPSSRSNIILGKVVTDATQIIYIDAAQINAHHYSNYLDRMLREALGPIFYTGGIVTRGTVSGSINVTAATYYFSETRITTNGASPATLHTFYRGAVSGQYVRTTGVTAISTSSYDNNTNSLTNIPSGKYTKHALYLLGDNSLQIPANEEYLMVYGQTLYDTVGDAIAGTLPTPPSYFTDQTVIIASIVVTPDSSSLQEIIDERPRLGFVSPSKTGVITSHGDLTGLSNDDHPQYLLTDGTRTLTGNMNIGGYNISNVNSITATSFTGSLQGTSSWATNAITASYALNTSNVGRQITSYIPFISTAGQTVTLTRTVAAVTEIGQELRIKTDLSGVASASLSMRVEQASVLNGPQVRVQYSTDEVTWNYLTANSSNYPSVALNTAGTAYTGKEAIVSGAKGIVTLRLITVGGDGTNNSTCRIGNVTLGTIYNL